MLTGQKVFLLAFAVSLNCSAFQAQQDRLCSIRGTVTNALTGEPLRKAFLRLVLSQGSKPFSNVVTDQEGKFTFAAVEPGHYQIEAQHQGFLNREFDQQSGSAIEFRLNPGDKLGDVSVKLTPQSVVSGRVVDEDGDLWTHAAVNVIKSLFKEGRRSLQLVGGGGVDDQGQFRIADLSPGLYFLFAKPDEYWEREYRSGDWHAQTTWYPSATDVGGSTPLVIAAGQSLSGLEIRVRRGVSEKHFIRGKVSSMEGMPGPQPGNPFSPPRVEATLDSELAEQNTGDALRADGSFEIPVATSGSYKVAVRTGLFPSFALGAATVQVKDRDVDNLVIDVKPPRPLSGVIRVEGDDKALLSGWSVGLESLGNSFGIAPVTSQGDGKLEFGLLAQESYRVFVHGQAASQFYVQRLRLGNTESRSGTFSFTGGDAPLEVILSRHPASLAVSITPSKVSLQRVVLIPDTVDAALREYGTAVAVRDQNGVFSLRGLAPGTYRLFAFESVPDDAWKDAEFVRSIQDKGTRIEVEEGASKAVEAPVLLKSEIAAVLVMLGME